MIEVEVICNVRAVHDRTNGVREGVIMAQVEVNEGAPAVGCAEAFVEAPIETVWAVLCDFESWPSWNKSVSKLELKGDVKVDTSFVWVAGESRIISRLEELDRPKRVVWSGRTFGIRAIHVWEFKEKDGGTIVRTKESFEGLIVRLFRGLMKRMLDKTLSQGVTALKIEAESRHGSTGV